MPAPTNTVIVLVTAPDLKTARQLAKAALTGKPPALGEHAEIRMR